MTQTPTNAVVWCEIPVRDMRRAMAFYESVFGYRLSLDESGPIPEAVFPHKEAKGAANGHLCPGTPAAPGSGPTLHMPVPGKLEEAMERCEAAGGAVVGPVIEIPPGRFVHARDPDGNSLGLFEPATGAA